MEYQTELIQDEIDILISRYLKARKYIRKLKNDDGKIKNYTHQIKYFTPHTHKMIKETARKTFIAIFKNASVKVNLIDYILQSIKKNNKKKTGTRNSLYISAKKYMTQSITEVFVKSCSISKFNTLNTLFRNYRQEYKDKNFMDNIIDKFVNKLKILINDEDNEIPSDKKKEIIEMINEKAKEKFQQILENTCEDYGYDPIQEYCKICNQGQYPGIEKEYKKFINAIETRRSAKEIGIFVVTNNINIKKLKTIASADCKIIICQFNELGGYIEQIEQKNKKKFKNLTREKISDIQSFMTYNTKKYNNDIKNLNKALKSLNFRVVVKSSSGQAGSINEIVKLSLKSENDCFLIREVNRHVAKAKNCVIITGAGISCSAGIPDFIGSDGLYNMIKSQYLGVFHSGKDLFDVQLLRTHETIKGFNLFMGILKELIVNAKPTATYSFIKKLADMKKLKRVYIQNIDNLEELVGFDVNWEFERVKNCKAQIFKEGGAPNCSECVKRENTRVKQKRQLHFIGQLKPTVILYSDTHPKGLEISQIAKCDQNKADCLLIMGTFLRISGLKDLIKGFARAVHGRDGCVILVNATDVANKGWNGIIDYQIEGTCDEWVKLVDLKLLNSKRISK
ncbi:561_t:CDS:10 [Gigaspora margarita]|uniref:561_t:CDS:1 n=1 Tax=Gigaspora margarita TaxID=4874 RepID=A0ABM8W5X0_GIGMA|nr:561_t:CDS:10 [Gigaspora margarita]